VDGNRIKVPDFLKDPPKPDETTAPFILDVLHANANVTESKPVEVNEQDDYDHDDLQLLLSRDSLSLSEFELVRLTTKWCERTGEDFDQWAAFFNFNALSDEQKAWVLGRLPITAMTPSLVMNGLMQSSILTPQDLVPFRLHYPALRWKRVFDSKIDRMGTFLDRTATTMEMFHKKLIILRLDERFAVAIYVSHKIERHQECQVDDSVRVFAFPQSQGSQSSRYRVVPTKVNYRLFCDGSVFQLYNNRRADTWIFLSHGPSDDSSYRNIPSKGDQRREKQKTIVAGVNYECRASIALNKISHDIQKHVGRVNRQGIMGAVCLLKHSARKLADIARKYM
jgi:regulator of nonsense transcripts 1